MVQEFREEITTSGEWSLIFFDNQFNHAVLKKALANDFRVQSDFGGSATSQKADDRLIEQAQNIIQLIPESLLYARVDGIYHDGKFTLMELELVEPALFLSLESKASDRFANAILSKLEP